jgi:hypothetical protein
MGVLDREAFAKLEWERMVDFMSFRQMTRLDQH